MKTKIVFMGTPDIACGMLQQLIDDDYEIVGVVSQPDKKVGRKQEIKMSEVKQLALKHQLDVFQPLSIKDDYQKIMEWKPDLIVTCAYGQFIPQEVLEYPPLGSINVHASLLPKLRGGAPIHWAIIHGHQETGISIMRMIQKMDAGAVMAQKKVSILADDTTGDVYKKLKTCGAELLHESIPKLIDETASFIEQDENAATFAYNISKEDEKINLDQDIHAIYNHIRGLIPFPVGYFYHDDKKIKLHKVRKKECAHQHQIGECCGIIDNGYAIAVNGGYILLDELQVEGKSKVDAKAFANAQGRAWLNSCMR